MTTEAFGDEFEPYLREKLADPEFRAAFEDAEVRTALLSDLVVERERQGLSQTEVAKRMQIAQPTLSEFEDGGSDPRLSTLMRYARVLDMKITVKIEPRTIT